MVRKLENSGVNSQDLAHSAFDIQREKEIIWKCNEKSLGERKENTNRRELGSLFQRKAK